MSRRRYLITYDVSDDKRRNKVFKILRDSGDHVQYSVFVCELTEAELVAVKGELDAAIHHREDQVLLLDLGSSAKNPADGIMSLGRAYEAPVPVLVV